MKREEALALLKSHLKDEYTLKHCLALEAIMRELAGKFNEDADKWGLAGLLHDIDWDLTKNDIGKHTLIGAEILEKNGIDADVVYAVKVHNERHGIEPKSLMDKWLMTSDNVTGLIIACALVMPDKKLQSVKPQSILKKFKDKSFAAATDRESISKCEELGIPLLEFLTFCLNAMQKISGELGL